MRRIAAILGTLLLLISSPAFAQDETPGENLGGYDTMAGAAAVSFQPFLPALVSTGDVPFEGSLALSSSRVKSGGNVLGRGALVWPGATLADFGPVLGVAFGQPEVGSLVPKWPLVAEANQDAGEVVTGAPPIASMRAFGAKDRADGDARVADVHIPRIVHIEHIASTSGSVVTDGAVTSTGIVKLHGVSLLAGFIKIEEIRSISRTSSIGSAASASGDVDIAGMKIGGFDVSVTDDGFQVKGTPPESGAPGTGDEPFPNASPEEAVNSILNALGARITLFKSAGKVVGGSAQRMQPGVIVSVDNPVGGEGPIPPGRFDIILAATSSSALATLPFAAGELAPGLETGGTTVSGASESTSGGETISLGGGTPVGEGTVSTVGDDLSQAAQGSLGAVSPLTGTENRRSDYRFGGLPLGMVIGLLLLALLMARSVRNAFAGLLAGGRRPGETP